MDQFWARAAPQQRERHRTLPRSPGEAGVSSRRVRTPARRSGDRVAEDEPPTDSQAHVHTAPSAQRRSGGPRAPRKAPPPSRYLRAHARTRSPTQPENSKLRTRSSRTPRSSRTLCGRRQPPRRGVTPSGCNGPTFALQTCRFFHDRGTTASPRSPPHAAHPRDATHRSRSVTNRDYARHAALSRLHDVYLL
jgi:hypothetical protein